ncbi:small multi-drug export protein [Schlesneria paludicola]|uniref:small multi-drug export protein n=1 Tax=Schlesneria paludicola TaxID=360056 RepID=UPI0007C4D850|nr:small multi-drug export protein [Schlesneria paludicola]
MAEAAPPPNNHTVPTAHEHEQLLESFLEFEQTFHKNYFPLWLGTLIGPFILTLAAFAAVYVVAGPTFCKHLLWATAASFAFLGRFSIITPFPGLEPTHLFWMVTFQDVMVALFFAFHVGFMFRVPWIGPKIAALSSDSEFILAHQPWMKRMTFLGLLAFIAFPLAATGSVGGAIFGRLLGLSRWAIFWGSTIGAVIGNAAMLFLAELVVEYLPADSLIVKWGGVLIIVLIIVFLERRYSSMKRAFEQQRQAEQAGVQPNSTNVVSK